MKNQYDFSPSNVPAGELKRIFMEEKVKVIDAMKSFPDVKIDRDYKLSGSKNDIEKVLSKLEKDLPNNPHVAKLMAMNTYQTITDPKLGSVHQVTVYGQKILLQINDDNNPDKIGNSNAQVWLNTANAIKESGLDTVVISAVNYKPVGVDTHGKGEALDILYVRQGGKDILIDKGKNAEMNLNRIWQSNGLSHLSGRLSKNYL